MKVNLLSHWRGDGDIARAFFEYYSDSVEEFHLIVHGPIDENREVLALRTEFPIAFHGRYDGPFDDSEKARRLNQLLPIFKGKWVLLVDSDEFVELPFSSISETIDALENSGASCLAAPMLQRLRSDGSLESPEIVRDPFREFPLCSERLYTLMGGVASLKKHPLFRCGPETLIGIGNHEPSNGPDSTGHEYRGVTHHFKWKRSAVKRISAMIDADWPWAETESVPYLKYLSSHKFLLPLDNSFAYSRDELFRRGFLQRPSDHPGNARQSAQKKRQPSAGVVGMPQISIIVPVFNTERYLEACLLSIIGQTFSDFEVICVDDLSTDRSREIVRDIARGDPRIRLICHEKNRGAGGARNTGLAEAKSRYVTFFDSDDYLDVDMLQLLHAASEDGAIDVVICGYRAVDHEGHVFDQYLPKKRKILNAHELKDRLLLGGRGTGPCNKLWRKDLFKDNGISFPTGMVWEDLATVPKLILAAKSINYIDRICYNYVDRRESNSNSTTASDSHLVDFFRAFDLLKEYLIAEGIYSAEKHNLEYMVRVFFNWHAEKLSAKENSNGKEMRQYAKFCALMAGGYISFDDKFRDLESAELIEQIATIASVPKPPSSKPHGLFQNFVSRIGQTNKQA